MFKNVADVFFILKLLIHAEEHTSKDCSQTCGSLLTLRTQFQQFLLEY
jgi:hypothetical protein